MFTIRTSLVRLSRVLCVAGLGVSMLASSGCDKSSGGGPSGATSTGSTGTVSSSAATIAATSTAVNTAAAGSASSAPSGGTAATPEKGASYTGEYKAAASKLSVPDTKEFKGFKFRGDESTEGLGPGTLELRVGPGGVVDGEGGGAFGAFTVRGLLADGVLTGNIDRKTKDGGFTGMLEGAEAAGALTGVIRASLGGGNVLREATFTLKKK
jgi:hypothetical protein